MKLFWAILSTLFMMSSCTMGGECPDYWSSDFAIQNMSGEHIKTVKMELIDITSRPEKTDSIAPLTIQNIEDGNGLIYPIASFDKEYKIDLSKKYKITVNDNLFFLAYDFKKSTGHSRQGCLQSFSRLNRCEFLDSPYIHLDMKCGLNKEEFDVFLEELRSRPYSEKVGLADAD
ncbi:MAG: hypothetical protein VXW65_01850 [Pseudomonadota bacterium]|nr:hypothetical protein [Pseudomonadota bacterium]